MFTKLVYATRKEEFLLDAFKIVEEVKAKIGELNRAREMRLSEKA